MRRACSYEWQAYPRPARRFWPARNLVTIRPVCGNERHVWARRGEPSAALILTYMYGAGGNSKGISICHYGSWRGVERQDVTWLLGVSYRLITFVLGHHFCGAIGRTLQQAAAQSEGDPYYSHLPSSFRASSSSLSPPILILLHR